MTNLFSYKKIFTGSIFLLIGLFYFTGVFDGLDEIKTPNLNPFSFPKPQANPSTSENKVTSTIPYALEVQQTAKDYQSNLNLLKGLTTRYEERLQETRHLIEAADCDTLKEYFVKNTGWELRPYTAYKIMVNKCPLE